MARSGAPTLQSEAFVRWNPWRYTMFASSKPTLFGKEPSLVYSTLGVFRLLWTYEQLPHEMMQHNAKIREKIS